MENEIIGRNLNGQVNTVEFFRAFGYTDEDQIFIRRFPDQKKYKGSARNYQCRLCDYPTALDPELHRVNAAGNGIFFVVNGGGNRDTDVTTVRALFTDDDNHSFEDQLQRLNEFPLAPSIIVKTRKSFHPYWLSEKSDDVQTWRELQNRLINHFGSDPRIENPSRVMRVPGFYHCKAEPVMVTLIKFNPELRYRLEQFDEVLPPLTEEQKVRLNKGAGSGTDYDARTIEIPARSTLESIARDKTLVWLKEWTAAHGIEIRGQSTKPDGSIWYGVACPWEADHSGDTGALQSAISVDQSGRIGYCCLHQHCLGRTWKDFRTFYEGQDGSDPSSVGGSLAGVFGAEAIVDVIQDQGEPIPEKDWVIEGLCTEGECAIVSGASKSGKSYLMTGLCIAAASGDVWLSKFPCRRSRVLYINGENQRDDARARFHSVFEAMAVDPAACEPITSVCADGIVKPLQELREMLIDEIRKNDYAVVVLDPLYCFYKGSEIDEQDAKNFVACVKTICRETGAVIFCVHHHSKGAAMYKNASSRASGSGMLQRAFSTLLDLSEITGDDAAKLPKGQRPFEFSGQPRQAAGFVQNLIFDFPVWRADIEGILPDNARNRGRTAAAREKNANNAKSKRLERELLAAVYLAFRDNLKTDDAGDYITLGDVVRVLAKIDLDVSERAIGRRLDDGGVPGYKRDERPGKRRFIRRSNKDPTETENFTEGKF